MINSITTAQQQVSVGSALLFTTDRIKTRSCQCAGSGWLTHEPGSGQFLISKPGYYEVNYGVDVTASSATPIILSINQNGESVAGSLSTFTTGVADEIGHIAESVLIFVPCGGSIIVTINNVGTTAITAQNATISIKRLS